MFVADVLVAEPGGPDSVVFDDAAAIGRILELIARGDPAADAVVVIDGPSGAGKSTLAGALVDAWPTGGPAPQLLSTDALVPGWDGLADGSAALGAVLGEFIAARTSGRDVPWRAWDWAADRPGETRFLRPDRPVIVEGSGSLTEETAELATVSVWVELRDEGERRARALERDGDVYAPHWERWAAQEAAHRRQHAPRRLADLVLDRTPR